MRTEYTLLGASLLLALVQIFLAGHFRTRQYGKAWNMGARDEVLPALEPFPHASCARRRTCSRRCRCSSAPCWARRPPGIWGARR